MKIAYLAPALTALESTFVYNELLALERRGIEVVPVSVHRPTRALVGHDDLLVRTHYLYDGGLLRVAACAAMPLWRLRASQGRALRWLASDLRRVGAFRPLGWKLLFQYLASARLAQILIRERCAHLHVHFAHVSGQIAMYASAMAGVPFTVMAHANDVFERGLLLREKAERAARMLTISEFNRAFLERAGVPREKLAVVRCGVGFPLRTPVPAAREPERLRIGTLARLVPKKGVDVVLRAFAELKGGGRAIALEIAGDGPLRAELQQMSRELGIERDVTFVGSLPHESVREWMRELDVFVLACRRDADGDMDGIPVVLMEAMSQSVPVVSTRLSGIPELVLDGRTGLLAAPDDPADLALRIAELLGSAAHRRALAAAALEHVEAEFGQAVNLDRLVACMGLATHA